MVGAATALGFARQNLHVALVEPFLPEPFNIEQAPDARVSAISLSSEQFLTELGAWQHVLAMRCLPYRRLSVWENPTGKTEFDSRDLGFAHMGHMVENRILQLALHRELQQLSHVHWFKQAQLIDELTGNIQLDEQPCSANVIVAADGANSALRNQAGIGTQGWQYSQSVLSVTVQCADSTQHADIQDMTWQVFHPSGPRAFLPMYERYASLIWYDAPQKVNALKSLPTAELKAEIQAHFPDLLPDFSILSTAAFPLTRMHAQQYVRGKVVLVGDSAHTINPLAGQGVNLGFKDAEALVNGLLESLCAEPVSEAKTKRQEANSDETHSKKANSEEANSEKATQYEPLGDAALSEQQIQLRQALLAYQKQRKSQNLLMMSAMDALYLTFSNNIHPLKLIRNIGLTVAGKAGWAKNQVMKYAMGM